MVQKKEFMLLFRYEPNNDQQLTESQINEMHQQWGAFIGNIAIQEKLVSTYQLGFEGVQVFSNKSVNEGFHISDKQVLGGNMVVRAISIHEAVEMAKDCPILLMGGTVEIRDIQPM
ncbi:hypothetical protein AD998_15930 [bacterium 336/3]|nr:hypothetical protein AD998_15930 [bacterium 336/3]